MPQDIDIKILEARKLEIQTGLEINQKRLKSIVNVADNIGHKAGVGLQSVKNEAVRKSLPTSLQSAKGKYSVNQFDNMRQSEGNLPLRFFKLKCLKTTIICFYVCSS